MVIQTWAFGRLFLKNEQGSLSLKRKQLRILVANGKTCVSEFFKKIELKKEFRKLDRFPILKVLSDVISNTLIDRVLLFVLCHEVCQLLECMTRSAKQYFPNVQCLVLRNRAWRETPSGCRGKLCGFT